MVYWKKFGLVLGFNNLTVIKSILISFFIDNTYATREMHVLKKW